MQTNIQRCSKRSLAALTHMSYGVTSNFPSKSRVHYYHWGHLGYGVEDRGEHDCRLLLFHLTQIENSRKNFLTAVGVFYYRIWLENSDFRLIDQLNVQRWTRPPTPATSLDLDQNRSEFGRKIFPATVRTFSLRIRSKNFLSRGLTTQIV